MNYNKNEKAGNLLPVTVTEGVTVNVLPDAQHEYLMTTKEVANGYGTSKYAIQQALYRNDAELIEAKHFVTALTLCQRELLNSLNLPHNAILWTKRGIIRLGLFIKSDRAKLFRDWAEDLVVKVDESAAAIAAQKTLFGDAAPKALPAKRRIANRIDRSRMVRLLAMTARIKDGELRQELVTELMGGFEYGQ